MKWKKLNLENRRELENSGQFLLLRTNVLQKIVVECPRSRLTLIGISISCKQRKKAGSSMSKLWQGISYPYILLKKRFRSNTSQKTLKPYPTKISFTPKASDQRSISEWAKIGNYRKWLYSTRPHDGLSVKKTFAKSTLRTLQNRLYQLRTNWWRG